LDERRSWISGFTGSAGTALIPADSSRPALLFVDSRYWIQAGKQVSKSWEVRRVGGKGGAGKDDVVGGWIDAVVDVGTQSRYRLHHAEVQELEDGSRIGIDPKLIALSELMS
jgi:Xaa-Pro aminopeptidase